MKNGLNDAVFTVSDPGSVAMLTGGIPAFDGYQRPRRRSLSEKGELVQRVGSFCVSRCHRNWNVVSQRLLCGKSHRDGYPAVVSRDEWRRVVPNTTQEVLQFVHIGLVVPL